MPRFVAVGGEQTWPRYCQALQPEEESEMEDQEPRPEDQGTYDTASMLYVLGGVPAMVLFFVGLFLLVGSCDNAGSMYIHA